MSLFGDFYFFGWAALLAIPAIILGIKEKPIKYYGFLVTIFFIWMAMGAKPIAIGYLAIYGLWQFGLEKIYIKIVEKYGRNRGLYWVFIGLSLMPLVVCKISGFLEVQVFSFLGISYMTFKSVQMIIETFDGLIREINLFDFLYFLMFFPALASGPIDRSRRFNQDLVAFEKNEYLDMVGNGLWKICLGLVYKFVLASTFYQGMLWLGSWGSLSSELIYMYSYGFYLFFDFAGYSLMAVGMSYIFGIKTPDNFNKPFISTDLKEFWDRWHISLSHWFRDFIFSRLMMRAIKGKWFKNKLTSASVGFIVNMTVMGLWHGLDWCYIIYGLYHGIFLSITEIYQKKSKFHKKHKKEKWYKAISWFITFNIVMFGFYIFSGRLTHIIGI